MAWRLARSLEMLRSEFNALAPNRSKISDGTRGDPAHAARESRHNPNRYDVVTALDITHDPQSGCDVHATARELVKNPHPELEYIISNRQVAHRKDGFQWRAYTGPNPHTQHAHFAVGRGKDRDPRPPYDSTAPWGVANTEDEDVVKKGDRNGNVGYWQRRLRDALGAEAMSHSFKGDNPDGVFGSGMEDAVKKVQSQGGLPQTGVIDLTTGMYLQALAHGKGSHAA